ncbi:MAG: alpha/beta fold hydrolase [Solirubrobacterales bacterium]
MVSANGVELCVETLGDRADPAILLIAGSNSAMDWWEDEFCDRLVAGGRFVIRYDHRDTGESVSYPPGAPDYNGDDLADDAVGILDALGIGRAHVVGISMGGAVAQTVALDYPDRVESLTVISTSFAVPSGLDLPGMRSDVAAAFAALERPDWSDRDAVIRYGVEVTRLYSGSGGFDEDSNRELWGRVFDRTRSIESTFLNHDLIHEREGRAHPPVSEIRASTLVFHGADDPLFPLEHGKALAAAIPGARLISLDGVGHELPRRAWDLVVPAILELTS